MKDLPEYKRENDVFWKVNRDFCTVSNWTYGPIEDWDEDKIRKSVDILRGTIKEMLWQLEDQKKSDQACGGREAMKLNDLYRIQDALEIICESSEATNYEEVVDALIGVCWDEETAGEIKFSMQDDDR